MKMAMLRNNHTKKANKSSTDAGAGGGERIEFEEEDLRRSILSQSSLSMTMSSLSKWLEGRVSWRMSWWWGRKKDSNLLVVVMGSSLLISDHASSSTAAVFDDDAFSPSGGLVCRSCLMVACSISFSSFTCCSSILSLSLLMSIASLSSSQSCTLASRHVMRESLDSSSLEDRVFPSCHCTAIDDVL